MTQPASAAAPTTAQPIRGGEPIGRASEQYMASLWSEIIGVEAPELSDTFLEVGGNSLTLYVVVNRIQTERGVSIEPVLFFHPDTSSLSELAKELDRLLDDADEPQRKGGS